MKQSYIFIFSFLYAMHGLAQINPQSKKITQRYFPDNELIQNVTPALKKDKGFTNYEELISFLNELKTNHSDYVTISYIGESQKGKNIPLVSLTNPNSKQEKTKVWMQGGLHGNEPGSSEGLLYLLHTLLTNTENSYLLDKIELAVIPMANIDGYLKQDRYAANGLDLNRDQTKLMAPESILLKQTFSNFKPEVALDFHEYKAYRKDFSKLGNFGIAGYYDVMFLYSGNLNVPQNMRTLTDSLFVQKARDLMDQNKLSHHNYVTTDELQGDIVFNQGSTNSRSSATSYALTNSISTLIEVRGVDIGRTSYKRRINTTFLIGMSYLKTAYDHAALLKKEIIKAQNKAKQITITSTRKIYKDTIQVIDLDTYEILDFEITTRDALKSIPKLSRNLPEAYLISPNQEALITKLKILGVHVETLQEDTAYDVECYTVVSYKKNNMPYEKMILQTVETNLSEKNILFLKGTYIISTHQKNAPVLTEVLEPEAPNSFVSFGVLKTELNQNLPIYRLPKKN
tara:strand:- start:1657 stop:3198 length:1542 start_codon:yes stop_codon:yes gene_type:complete